MAAKRGTIYRRHMEQRISAENTGPTATQPPASSLDISATTSLTTAAAQAIPKFPEAHIERLRECVAQAASPREADRLLALLIEDLWGGESDAKVEALVEDLIAAIGKENREVCNTLAWIARDVSLQGPEHLRFRIFQEFLNYAGYHHTQSASFSPFLGFVEYSPEVQPAYKKFKQKLLDQFELIGTTHIQLPLIARKETIQGVGTRRDLISVQDSSNSGSFATLLGGVLIPEHTIGLAQYALKHRAKLPWPLLASQLGPVFRSEPVHRAKLGQSREFDQADLDELSPDGLDLDHHVDIPLKINSILKAIGVEDTCFRVANRQIFQGALTYFGVISPVMIQAVISAMDGAATNSRSAFQNEVAERLSSFRIKQKCPGGIVLSDDVYDFFWELRQIEGSSQVVLPAIEHLVSVLRARARNHHAREGIQILAKGLSEYSYVLEQLERCGQMNIKGDNSVVRTCPIYSGTEFEVEWISHDIGSIAGGGAYNLLTNKMAGVFMAGFGMCIGVTRVFGEMVRTDTYQKVANAQILVTQKENYHPRTAEQLQMIRAVSNELRVAAIPVRELRPSDVYNAAHLQRFAELNRIPLIYFVDTQELHNRSQGTSISVNPAHLAELLTSME